MNLLLLWMLWRRCGPAACMVLFFHKSSIHFSHGCNRFHFCVLSRIDTMVSAEGCRAFAPGEPKRLVKGLPELFGHEVVNYKVDG